MKTSTGVVLIFGLLAFTLMASIISGTHNVYVYKIDYPTDSIWRGGRYTEESSNPELFKIGDTVPLAFKVHYYDEGDYIDSSVSIWIDTLRKYNVLKNGIVVKKCIKPWKVNSY